MDIYYLPNTKTLVLTVGNVTRSVYKNQYVVRNFHNQFVERIQIQVFPPKNFNTCNIIYKNLKSWIENLNIIGKNDGIIEIFYCSHLTYDKSDILYKDVKYININSFKNFYIGTNYYYSIHTVTDNELRIYEVHR